MEHVHEYIKTKTNLLGESGQAAKYEEAALNALNNDQKRNFKVEVAANTLRRLVKAGASGEQYKAKARELFKYAKYFEWLMLDNTTTHNEQWIVMMMIIDI